MTNYTAVVCCVFLLSAVAAPPVGAENPNKNEELSIEETLKALVEAPAPDYPSAFRAKRLEGTGLFELRFNPKTGRVDVVKVLKSTGHFELDTVAVKTLKRWRCRPGALDVATVPITFTYGRRPSR